MKPLKNFKKIRQFRGPKNSLLAESIRRYSYQPSAQRSESPCPVPDGEDHHFRRLCSDGIKNRIVPGQNFCLSGKTPITWKSFGILRNGHENFENIAGKSLAGAGLSFVIKVNRFRKLPFRLFFDDNAKRHLVSRNRFSMSATTSPSGRQRSGCSKACWARRSSSAICSGVKSGSYPSSVMISQKSCASLMRSSCGRAFAASRISVVLMPAIYRTNSPAQAQFFVAWASPFVIPNSRSTP